MPDHLAPLLESHSPEVAATLRAARDLLLEVIPGATEQLDLPDHLVAYSSGPSGGVRLRDMQVALIPHKAHVNVQLADGAILPDPSGIIEGTGKRIRHVKCRSSTDVRRPALRALLEAQARSRGV